MCINFCVADVFTRYFLGQPESIEGIISESKYLLDDSNAAKEQMDNVKKQLKYLLYPGYEVSPVLLAQANWPTDYPQPYVVLQEISNTMTRLRNIMRLNWATKDIDQLQRRWCCFESPNLFKERWEKMFSNFCKKSEDTSSSSDNFSDATKSDTFWPDPSSVPELYDSLKYDALHNRQFLEAIFNDPEVSSPSSSASNESTNSQSVDPANTDLRNLYSYVRELFHFVAPQEYGISEKEKKTIGMLIGLPLLKSIVGNLEEFKNSEKPKTRLYFTKGKIAFERQKVKTISLLESHVHALLNLVYLSGLPTKFPKPTLPELDCKFFFFFPFD